MGFEAIEVVKSLESGIAEGIGRADEVSSEVELLDACVVGGEVGLDGLIGEVLGAVGDVVFSVLDGSGEGVVEGGICSSIGVGGLE